MAAKKTTATSPAAAILANPDALKIVEALIAQAQAKPPAATPKVTVLSTYQSQGATEEVIIPRPLEADEEASYGLYMAHGTNRSWCLAGLQGTRIMRFEVRSSNGTTTVYERTAMGRFFKNMSK